jgi:hypothetical protein
MSNREETKSANNVSALQADVTETTNILKVTVGKLIDREEKLTALSERADDLHSSSAHFHGSARRVQRKFKWHNRKITIIIGKFLTRQSTRSKFVDHFQLSSLCLLSV